MHRAVLMLCCVGVKCSLCGITNSPSDLPQAIQTNDTQMTIRIINTHTIRSPFLRHFTWRALNTHAHRHYSFTVPPTLHVSSLSHNKSITNIQHSHTEILHTVTGVRFGCNAHTHHTHTPFIRTIRGPHSFDASFVHSVCMSSVRICTWILCYLLLGPFIIYLNSRCRFFCWLRVEKRGQ